MSQFELHCEEPFTGSIAVTEQEDQIWIEVTAQTDTPAPMNIRLSWYEDDIRSHVSYSPIEYIGKQILPNWAGNKCSMGVAGAPFYCMMDSKDQNRLSVACSDALNPVFISIGLEEETAAFSCYVNMITDYPVSNYKATVLVDKRNLPFYQVTEDVAKWWETLPGYTPAKVPEAAKRPYYSTWYSFHQNTDADEILKELAYAKELGCTAVIVDDGWQCSNSFRGYDYCGDWEPFAGKIPDMKAFVDGAHALGMKFLLWYSVPFIGRCANCRSAFQGKMLSDEKGVLDPRYPENRDFLKNTYIKAVQDWGLDGFKLDFIDSFPCHYPDTETSSTAPGKDYTSVHQAVDVLFKDILSSLRTLNPDILIEFRQSYIGPLMRTYGNIFRASDCPNDSRMNRMSTLSLRHLSGNTAVHSDMIMWNPKETAEEAAFQFTNILFSVPQISVRHDYLPEDHRQMLRFYTKFWSQHRHTLLDGKMFYKDYHANYTYVSSTDEKCTVGVLYSNVPAPITNDSPEIVLVNATMMTELVLDVKQDLENKHIQILNCMGQVVAEDSRTIFRGYHSINIPVNGMAVYRSSKKR